jgi:hypothetical protein
MLWDNLDSSEWDIINNRITSNQEFVPGEPITGYQANPTNAYILISSDGKFHFLISTENISEEDILHPNAAGLNIEILRNHPVSDVPRQDYIDIFCSGRHHIEAFTEIVKEISQKIFEENQQSINAVNHVIRKWKSFWGKPPGSILGIDEQVGLIGELHILEYLISHNLPHSVESWNNPLNLVHDFVFEVCSLEIKTTRSNNHKHIINGLEQLEPISGRILRLFSIIALEENIGISLNGKIENVLLLLQEQPDLRDVFFDKLSNRGYRPEHENYYDQNRYRLTDIRIFQITNDFPRLVQSSLVHPLPGNISNIRYTLDFEGQDYVTLDTLELNVMGF